LGPGAKRPWPTKALQAKQEGVLTVESAEDHSAEWCGYDGRILCRCHLRHLIRSWALRSSGYVTDD
jgi:hypothetical protein